MKKKFAGFALAFAVFGTMTALADNVSPDRQKIYDDVQKTFGSVPTFVKQFPDAALACCSPA